MTIDSRHPDHTALIPTWSRARDVLAGEDAVKAAAEKYLPRLESQTDDEYNAYRTRAAFFGATARTMEKCLDLFSRHAPVLNLAAAPALAPFTQNVDPWGTDLSRYARRVLAEVLSVGRAGTLLLPAPTFNLQPSSFNLCATLYRAEHILNWELDHAAGQPPPARLKRRSGHRASLQAGQSTRSLAQVRSALRW
jgi:hypothetical protein